MESKSVEEAAEATGLSEEQVKRKYPFSFGQVKPAKGTFKEGMSQAVDLGTDIAPIVGTAKAVADLPEDAELIKELIAAGYEEGDIKKMGMGGAYTALTVAGLIPGVKVAADITKKGIKEGVESAVEETATQTARALNVATEKSPLRTLYDDLPETERAMLPQQPDEYGLYGYHGTASARGADEPFFDINFARTNDQFLGEGFYFTLDPEIASEYASLRSIGRNFEKTIKGDAARKILTAPNVQKQFVGGLGKDVSVHVTPGGDYVTVGSIMKGKNIYGEDIAQGQYVSRFDLSNLKKPYVVRTEKQRKELKNKIPELKEQGYDSILFADFKDRSKQIMVFPEHMDKIDTSSIAGRSASASSRQIGNPEYDAIFSKLDELETPEEWQSAAKNLVSGERDITGMSPVRRTPELEQSARDLIDNKLLTREEHLKNVAENKPITEWTDLPRQPSSKAMVFSLKPSQRENGLFLLSGDDANKLGVNQTTLKDGDMFNGRLDIPAYQSYDTWVVAGTSPAVKTADGKGVTTYAKAIHYTSGDDKPVKFVASQKTSEGIGKGEKPKTGYATISGRYKDTSEEELRALAEKYLNDPEWSQVGFDPRRLGTFYLRRSTGDYKIGTPVTEADEVIQIGPLVLAKNAKLDPDYQGYNKGGAVPMKEQMEMFEDGGLMDEGGTVDPVSGNDVPPGSTQEEVRDDIPAQLSEGEFVFPADVVRYIGLGNLMRMRQEAKMGLRLMEEMGQMGNSEEATIPDDIPFDINDLDMEDELEYNVGGFVPANQQQQQMGISGYQAAPMPTTSFAPQPVQAASQQFVQPVTRPAQAYVPVQTAPTPLPTFGQITGPGVPEVDFEFATFRNEAGQEIQLRIKKGSKGKLLPGEVLPEGYFYVDPTATATEEVTTTPTTVQTATVREDDNEPPVSAEETAIQRARVAAAKKLGITDQVGFSIAGAFGKYGPEDVGKFTPTGFIIGKNGVLLDPLTGTAQDESGSTNILGAIVSALSENEEPPEPAYSDSFFENMPDQAKDVLGRSLGKEARDARLEDAAQRRQSFEDKLSRRDLITDVTKTGRASLREKIAREKQEEINKTKNDISIVQAQARAEIASRDNPQQAAERAQREARERQEDRNDGGSGQTIQEKADSYTADRVAEAVSTGDFSRGFKEGGLAAKKKPKAKKMKRGGLASKK